MSKKISKNLQEGINYLGAKRAEGGYRYYDDATDKWFISSESEVRDLGKRLLASDSSASSGGQIYSGWCSDSQYRESKTQRHNE